MQYILNPFYKVCENEIVSYINNFNSNGFLFRNGKRNVIKLFDIDSKQINIKSFKKPHFFNSIIYKYFRKSKAQRSFEFAKILLENNIGTPQPIAYFQNYNFIGLKDSYYVCEHLETELTFRELVTNPDYPNHETILRQFTKFSFDLHEKGIEFLDHSPGNTLINNLGNGNYDFYLVDLNRMNFHQTMPFELRMKNLSRLTPKSEMVAIMSEEYAKLYSKSTDEIFEKMWYYTNEFQEKHHRKRRLKKKLFFWK
ncbi:MAG: Kdo domain containing protein [Flavobacteriaceae bacterium]|nr:Kdo domain containing protein [Flavobacteriaceae bacterium]